MLPRKNRLAGKKNFDSIFKRGRAVYGRGVGVKFLAKRSDVTRIAFVVSTKVAKRANVRNTLKRRLREIIRASLPDMASGFDIVVMTKAEALKFSFAQLREAVLELLSRARLLAKK